MYTDIVCKGVTAPLFTAPTTLTSMPPFLNFFTSSSFILIQPLLRHFIQPLPPCSPLVNLPSSSNTSTSSSRSHWSHLLQAFNHNHLNYDDTNQTNIVLRRAGILRTLLDANINEGNIILLLPVIFSDRILEEEKNKFIFKHMINNRNDKIILK